MMLSLVIVALPIGVALAIEPSKAGDPVHVIDSAAFQADLAAARTSEPFAVLSPAGLPAGWRATSETYQPPGASAGDWHVGYLTPSGGFVELEQTTEALGGFLSDQHADAVQTVPVPVAGTVWQHYAGSAPPALKNLLIRSDGKSTVIVAGSAPMGEMEQFAASLTVS
jgi:hypothetical protein